MSAHTEWQDNFQVRLGNGADFRMYHDGSNTFLRNYNHAAGNIYFQGEDTEGTNHALIYMINDVAEPYVRLFQNGAEKLRTVSGGVDVSGSVYVDANIYHNADENTYIKFDADRIRLYAGGTLKFDTNNTYLTTASTIDADTLNGATESVSASNNTIVKRHSSGYIYANYFNTTPNDIATGSITKIVAESGNDGFMRHASAAAVRSFLNVANGATANAGTVTSVSGGTGLSGTVTTSGSLNLTNTGVTAASYTNANITVDDQGRITAASNGSAGGITSITVGSGLDISAGNTPEITVDLNELTTATTANTTDFATIVKANGDTKKILFSEVIDDLDLVTGNVTGSLFAEVIQVNTLNANKITANSITAAQIQADAITANEINAGAITAEQLQISNNSSGSAGIFMDYNGGNSRIDIRDSSALRVRIGYLA